MSFILVDGGSRKKNQIIQTLFYGGGAQQHRFIFLIILLLDCEKGICNKYVQAKLVSRKNCKKSGETYNKLLTVYI